MMRMFIAFLRRPPLLNPLLMGVYFFSAFAFACQVHILCQRFLEKRLPRNPLCLRPLRRSRRLRFLKIFRSACKNFHRCGTHFHTEDFKSFISRQDAKTQRLFFKHSGRLCALARHQKSSFLSGGGFGRSPRSCAGGGMVRVFRRFRRVRVKNQPIRM